MHARWAHNVAMTRSRTPTKAEREHPGYTEHRVLSPYLAKRAGKEGWHVVKHGNWHICWQIAATAGQRALSGDDIGLRATQQPENNIGRSRGICGGGMRE